MKELTYRMEFDPELDFEATPIWVLDASHCTPPWTPLAAWSWAIHCAHGGDGAMETVSLPYSSATWMRLVGGAVYYGFPGVKNEEEAKRREAKFREWMRPYLEDYEKNWDGKPEKELMALWEPLKKFDVDNASNYQLWLHIEDCFHAAYRMWYIHVLWNYIIWCPYVLLESLCKQFAGIDDTDPTFLKLVTGFDNKIFQVDRKVWQFSRKAIEMGLQDIFMNNESKDVISQLETTNSGRKWLSEFREFINEDGWRSQRKLDFNGPTWIEDPTPVIDIVKLYLKKRGEFDLDKQREKATKERELAEREVLAKIPDEQKGLFTKILRIAQNAGVNSEGHVYYCEDQYYAITRRALMALGRRYVKAGTFDSPDDIFFLLPEEIRMVIFESLYFNLRLLVKRRREEYERWQRKPLPPFLLKEGTTPDQVGPHLIRLADPIFFKSCLGSMPKAGVELKADLYGQPGSPGVVEGSARVLLDENELFKVKEGDILVASNTAPSWTPVFNLIKGAVVDMGGSLAHAAVVGREFGIPVVTNTLTGTQKIKTGQRIRVDGNMGVVFFLDK